MFQVQAIYQGKAWFLYRTIWRDECERADFFETREQAQTALTKALKFKPKSFGKLCSIVAA